MKSLLTVISGVLIVVAYIIYCRSIILHRTKPAKASWIVWSGLDVILLAGMVLAHAVSGQIIGVTLGAASAAVLSLKYGAPGWTKLDRFCFAVAVIAAGFIVWGRPVYAIVASLMGIGVGALPTVRLAWRHPERENKATWSILFTAGLCQILAVRSWTLAAAATPLLLITLQSTMMYLLWIRPRRRRP